MSMSTNGAIVIATGAADGEDMAVSAGTAAVAASAYDTEASGRFSSRFCGFILKTPASFIAAAR
ncbi:hypothetical protein ACU4GI_16170 [Cupriavidus basilensis]